LARAALYLQTVSQDLSKMQLAWALLDCPPAR